MPLYYLLIAFERFHEYPRLAATLFTVGFPITIVKTIGLVTVVAAMILPKPHQAAPHASNPLAGLFLAFAGLSLLGTVAFGIGLSGDSLGCLVSLLLLMIATRNLVSTEERTRKTVRTLVLAATFSSLWCFKEHFLGEERAWGVGGDPNYEAMALVLTIPFAIWMARQERSTGWRIAGVISAAALTVATVFTESRGALVALAVVAFAEMIRARRKPALILALLLGTGMMVAFAPASVWQRFQSIKVSGKTSNGDAQSTEIRFELIKSGLYMIEAHPLFGVGLDQFAAVSAIYNPGLKNRFNFSGIACDTYVQVAAETGIPTLIIFLTIMFVAYRNCRRAERLQPNNSISDLAGAMNLALLSYAISSFFLTAQFLVPFWVIVFLSQSIYEICAAPSSVEPRERKPIVAVIPRTTRRPGQAVA